MRDLRGLYVLVLEALGSFIIKVGKLGKLRFLKGRYLYIGSATGVGSTSLECRVKRHLKKRKRRFWHIDYLTTSPSITIQFAICFSIPTSHLPKSIRLECQIVKEIMENIESSSLIEGFGSSDCSCRGHLIYLGEMDSTYIIRALTRAFKNQGYSPFICMFK